MGGLAGNLWLLVLESADRVFPFTEVADGRANQFIEHGWVRHGVHGDIGVATGSQGFEGGVTARCVLTYRVEGHDDGVDVPRTFPKSPAVRVGKMDVDQAVMKGLPVLMLVRLRTTAT